MSIGLADLTAQDLLELKGVVPQTDDELWDWIRVVCGIAIPRVAVCAHHCPPFEWVADAYFDRAPKQIVLASRGGGKTICAAALAYAELLHRPGVEIASVGAILKQARKMYRYFRGYTAHDTELGLCRPPTMEHTEFENGSRIEIITGRTKEAVNSPHPNRCSIDEYELMDEEVLEEALLMPVATTAQPYSIRLLSTRKFASGNVQRMLDQAPERGYKIHSFCALECTEQCTFKARPSCEPCKQIVRFDQNNQPVSFYDICQERLRKARGFLSVDKLIDDFRGLRVETFRTQVAPCDRPSRGNACFSEFSEDLHVIDWDYNPALPIGSSWDFGLDDPNVFIAWQWDALGNVVAFDEMCSGMIATAPEHVAMLIDQVGAEVLKRPYAQALRASAEHWADPAGKQKRVYTRVDAQSAFDVLRGQGLNLRGKKKPNPARRIEAMKMKLRLHDQTRRPSLFIARRCKQLIASFTYAQWAEGKENYLHDEYSHPLDSAGYFIDARWPPKSHYLKDEAAKVDASF